MPPVKKVQPPQVRVTKTLKKKLPGINFGKWVRQPTWDVVEEKLIKKKAKLSVAEGSRVDGESRHSSEEERIQVAWRLPILRPAFSDPIQERKNEVGVKRARSEDPTDKYLVGDDGAGFRKKAKFTLQLFSSTEDSSPNASELDDDAESVIKHVISQPEVVRNAASQTIGGNASQNQHEEQEDESNNEVPPNESFQREDSAAGVADEAADGAGIIEEEEGLGGTDGGVRGRTLRFCFFVKLRSQEAEPNQPQQGP